MNFTKLESPFLRYLIAHHYVPGERLPPLSEVSQEMGISVGKLREQLEVARGMGLVSLRPRRGMSRESFDFSKIILDGTLFGLATGEADFQQFSLMRQVVEVGFWDQAVVLLTAEDKTCLRGLVAKAWDKLRGEPIHIPNSEHRDLHLSIYGRLENPFVQGILTTYWDTYEASELTRFMSYTYWVNVWNYHERIVEALCINNFALGRQLLVEHFSLLRSLTELSPELPAERNQPFLARKGELK